MHCPVLMYSSQNKNFDIGVQSMSDALPRKNTPITVEPGAKSKNLEASKEKFSAVKKAGRISVGNKPLPKDTANEFSVREGSSLKTLRISNPTEGKKEASSTNRAPIPHKAEERALKPNSKPNSLSAAQAQRNSEGKFPALPEAKRISDKPVRVDPSLVAKKDVAASSSFFKDDLSVRAPSTKAKATPVVTTSRTKEPEHQENQDLFPDMSTFKLSNVVGAAITGAWFIIAAVYAQFFMGIGTLFSQQPHIIGGFLAGILAPVALLWMIISHIQRGRDVHDYAVALHDELKILNAGNKNNNINNAVQNIDLSKENSLVVESINRARAGLRHEIKNLNLATEKTGSQLDKINDRLSDRASKLLNMSEEMEKRASSFEETASKQMTKFLSNAASQSVNIEGNTKVSEEMLSKTDGLTAKMDSRIQSLNSVLGKMEGTLGLIEGKGNSAADKLSKAVQDNSAQLTGLEGIISKSIEKLTSATGNAKDTVESLMQKSSDKVTEINKSGEKTAAELKGTLELIDASRTQIETTSKSMGEQVQKTVRSVEKQAEEMAKAQATLVKRIDDMHLQVSEPLAAVNRAVEKAVNKHGDIEKALDQRIETLNTASEKAVERTAIIRDGLREQTQEMSTMMGQLAGHSRSVKAMLKDENENLAENVKLALEKVDTVGGALRGQSDKLDGVIANAEERIGKISSVLSDQSMHVVKNTGRIITDLKDIELAVGNNVKSLVEKSITAKSAVSGVAEALSKSAKDIEPVYKKATEQINQTNERFEKMSEGFEGKTTRNIDKLKSFETLFDERLKTLSSSAEDASHILEKSSDNLGSRVNDIDNATLSAQKKLQDIDNLFKNHVSDIHITTDQALLKIDTVQNAMNSHFQDLSASVAESLAQMKDVSAQFVKQTEEVDKLSNSAIDGLDSAGTKANDKVKSLNKLAKTTAEQMETMLNKVQNEAKHLLETSTKTLNQMKTTGDDFGKRAKQFEDQMKNSATSTKKYGDELGKQVDKVSKTSQKSATDIEKAMAQLAKQLLDVKEVSKDVTKDVTASRDKLSGETEHMAELSLKASRVVEEAASSYTRQSLELTKATTEAANHIEKVRESDWRVQRDAFLNSTRFVLESLHSLSVDLTRMVDGDIQEKVWKAYQKGDIAAFTRRLIENRSKLPYEKMSKKYSDDNEFRTYANRFIRQFEELYGHAQANDYGELISATFASSDVGGLYGILCQVSGREDMTQELGRRAA